MPRHPLAGRGQRKRDLESTIARNARATALPVGRYRDIFCRTILVATLERAVERGHIDTYCVKGGTAIELRFGSRARATRDLDLELPVPLDKLVAVFASALDVGYGDFTMRLKRGPRPIRDEAIRVEVAMQFMETDWTTINVDLAPAQAGNFADDVPLSLRELSPDGLPLTGRVMRTEYLIAQKVHAVTTPDPPTAYARHVVDIVYLYRTGTDIETLRGACHAIFDVRSERDGRARPPAVDLPTHWEREYGATIDAYGMTASPTEITRDFNNLLGYLRAEKD